MEENQATESLGDLLDHEYDGIREYDNPCPSWWLWIFFLTAVFAPFYFFYFHIGKAGITIHKDHENAIADNVRLRFSEIGELALDEKTLLEYMEKPEWEQLGRSVYEQKCKSCHGDGGRGLVGPNLTDDYFKNVEKLPDIITVITKGAANGSMPAWNRLHPNEILLVSAYVANMRKNPLTGARGEEGKLIPPWPKPSDVSPAPKAADETDSKKTDDTDEAPAKTT